MVRSVWCQCQAQEARFGKRPTVANPTGQSPQSLGNDNNGDCMEKLHDEESEESMGENRNCKSAKTTLTQSTRFKH